MKKIILIAVWGVLLAGCATHSNVVPSADTVAPVPGKAKIVIERSADKLYMGAKARIYINGEQVVELWREDVYAGVFQPGKVAISTDAWGTKGKFTVLLKLEPDQLYEFVVSPNDGHYKDIMQGIFWPSLLAGPIGMAVQQTTYEVKENQGPFLIKPKTKNVDKN